MTSIIKSKAFKRSITASILIITYFLFVSQFWAELWIFIIPIGVFLIVLFSIIFISSIIFWIKNRDYNRLYIPFCINVLSVLIVFSLPSYNRSKRSYIGSGALYKYKTGNCGCNLYSERFNVFNQGAWGTGLNSEYLTDSISFRKFLGTYDEGYENINISCKGDSIIITKTGTEFISIQWSYPRVLERKSYSLSELKKRHDFD